MSQSPATPQELREAASVVSEHLPAGYTAEFDGHLERQDGPSASTSDAALPPSGASSLKLQGGDMHRDLFKMDARAQLQSKHKRAATFHTPRDLQRKVGDEEEGLLTVGDQLAPGGFRRVFLRQKQGNDFIGARLPITRNFVEFLELYGSFAGEDLADSDEEEAVTDEQEEAEDEEERRRGETRPLLGRRQTGKAARSADAGTTKTFFTLLKAFIGTGIMFLPKAFNNGGILFSSMAMLAVSAVSMVAFHLLLQCKKRYGGGYGDIGLAVAGAKMRGLILGSITLSQLGFVCAGIVFVAENLLNFSKAVTNGHSPVSTTGLILIQLVALFPLAFIRNISKLGPAALLADVCILVGVTYIYYYDISSLVTRGMHPSVVLFNPDRYTLTIGAAIFTFEGIGLILPIESSMARPQHFEWLLGAIMLIITIIFTSVGALCYATFGKHTQIEIINNYPQDSKLVNAVQFLYSVAVLVGTPVQLFPALRILEGKTFGHRSGKKSVRTKWIKNAFRMGLVVLCGGVSIAGASNLDPFVALIGSFACVPLVYIYPPYLHYRGVATTWWAKTGDVVMIVVGIVCMIYTTAVTIINGFLR